MKLVILYGPPAVGKLAVANALAKLTGFKVLHNHLVSDLALTLFERGTPSASDLNHRVRCIAYQTASEEGLPGVISTFVYRYDIKDQIHAAVQDYVSLMQKQGGEICVVRLSCDLEELQRRVVSTSRIGTQKIATVRKLNAVLAQEDLLRELPSSIVKSLHIDNTRMSPRVAAQNIREHFKL